MPGARNQAWFYLIGGPLIACMTVALIYWSLEDRRLPAWLKPLAALGTVSYAAYLWNYPLKIWLAALKVPGDTFIVPVLTIVAAAISWFLVEAPMRRLRFVIDGKRERSVLSPHGKPEPRTGETFR